MNQLVVFVRAPRPGFTKTRLARQIGPVEAARASIQIADHLFARLRVLPQVEIRFTPDEARAEIQRWLQPGWQARAQGDGSLGERLRRGAAESFARGATHVALIGSDCPHITPGDIEEAWGRLATHEVVLGPAADGGYWLIGLRAAPPRLFEQIDWGTPRVLDQTVERAAELGLTVSLLRSYCDIDTEADWRAYLATIQADAGQPQ